MRLHCARAFDHVEVGRPAARMSHMFRLFGCRYSASALQERGMEALEGPDQEAAQVGGKGSERGIQLLCCLG